ncbi:hypothetical protein LEP1GSC017_3915 [Leptospira meyeri serovar Hardjo str. Went 5]|nr:hypothetical protein LEP1GSC017_3915 [Leptospira meyeri serovar Hardjo str. Went 5]EMJ86703.1 hypothetical protein LEP1GSC196_3034 [Leptospira meyeri serovar Semaranga str. Veldrot Semarang 173]
MNSKPGVDFERVQNHSNHSFFFLFPNPSTVVPEIKIF